VSAEVTSRMRRCRRTERHHDSPLTPVTAAEMHAPATSDGGHATNLKSTLGAHTHTVHHYRARQLYNNISMLFLFPVKYGKLSTGFNATFNASCYG